jgi:transposase
VDRPAGRARRINRLVSPRRGRDYLRRLGFTRQVPRPRHAEGDFAAQERFKAGFRARVQELTRANPDRSVQVWAFDEHRAGLKPVLRRIWARRGQRPLARGHQRFQGLYVYGFVRPATGEVVWFLAEAVNAAMFSEILAAFARDVGAGPDKLVVIVLDGAGWHTAGDLVVPEGIRLEFLPPYSPELQPAEHLWPLINEPLANEHFHTLADLDQVLGERCCDLADDHDRIRSSTRFHWWPAFI